MMTSVDGSGSEGGVAGRAPGPPGGPDGSGAVGAVFLRLGLTSFGGPIAHLGFFRTELVDRRRWLDDGHYADCVALAQVLPGPASSQVAMMIGQLRAGVAGLLMAFVAFTLPSAVLLIAAGVEVGGGAQLPAGVVSGLKVASVAVVAHAVLSMARVLCRGWARALLAVGSAGMVLAVPTVWAQTAVIVLAALIGLAFLRGADPDAAPAVQPERGPQAAGAWVPAACLVLFAILLVGLPLAARLWPHDVVVLVAGFYRAGALVFGGGHVVLPMLEGVVVDQGFVSQSDFLAGYGLANAVPGPLFTFAGYLGAVAGGAWLGAACVLAIFLPSILLVLGVAGHWDRLRGDRRIRRALAAVNAAVVGLLAAALYDPVITSGITDWRGAVGAALAFVALVRLRAAPHWVVLGCAALGGLLLG